MHVIRITEKPPSGVEECFIQGVQMELEPGRIYMLPRKPDGALNGHSILHYHRKQTPIVKLTEYEELACSANHKEWLEIHEDGMVANAITLEFVSWNHYHKPCDTSGPLDFLRRALTQWSTSEEGKAYFETRIGSDIKWVNLPNLGPWFLRDYGIYDIKVGCKRFTDWSFGSRILN